MVYDRKLATHIDSPPVWAATLTIFHFSLWLHAMATCRGSAEAEIINHNQNMRILGLDFGERRLGFAVSDLAGSIAMPLCVVEAHTEAEALKEVCRILEETEADRLIVGLPVNMNGTKGSMAAKVDSFVNRLTRILSIPVEKWDERLSTSAAERVLIDADMSRARRRAVRDKLAAQMILQGYLDARSEQRREELNGPL